MLHHIQRSILDQLASKSSARYSEINAHHTDGNTFTYHVRRLMAAKYVTKADDGTYQLTQKGKTYIVHRYEDPQTSAHSVFLIVARDGAGNYLLRQRLVQPHLDFYGFVHGEPKENEPILETASKRFYDKTGLRAHMQVFSSGLIRIYEREQLESFSHCVVIAAEVQHGSLKPGDATGENVWSALSKFDSLRLLPSTRPIIDAVHRNDQSFFDSTYTLNQ